MKRLHSFFRRSVMLVCVMLAGFAQLFAQDVVKIEYFVDADPGFGAGANVPVSQGLNVDANFQFNINALSPGFHNLYTRAFVNPYQVTVDGNTVNRGGWSLASVRTFYKEVLSNTGGSLANVIKGEYFVDIDPGFGNGTNIPIVAGTDISNGGFTFDVTSLTTGFHNLYIRFKDANGKWSLASSRNFYKETFTTGTGGSSNITMGEYFADSDPGYGKGISIPVTPGNNLTNISFTFDITSLATGFHNLYARFKNDKGLWSSVYARTFYKETLTTGNIGLANITAGEFFVDADPGYGNGKSITVAQGANLNNVNFAADVTNITAGFHTISTRFKDANGKWSHTNIRSFYKEEITQATTLANVVKVEYYIDTDPGYGKGTDVGFTPATNVTSLNFPVNMTNVSIGNHKIYVRALDANGKWSLISIGSFSVQPPAAIYITVGNLDSQVCAGSPFNVPFTVNTPYGSNNLFTAQLSDVNGSFANPVNIGSFTGNNNDTIRANIPANAAAGNAYRIRILASSPFDTSAASSTSFSINRVPEHSFNLTGKTPVCNGPEIYMAGTAMAGVKYTWSLSGGGPIDTSTATASVVWTTAGLHTLSVTPSNGCGNGQQRSLQVRVFGATPALMPGISINNRLLTATGGTAEQVLDYQWYKDGGEITGATANTYNAAVDGSYTVRFTNTCGNGPLSAAVSLTTKQDQTITFDPAPQITYIDTFIVVKAVASSGRPVTYSLVGGPANLKSDTVAITGAGNITIRATQAGNDTLNAASADLVITVLKAKATLVISNLDQVYNGSARNVTVVTKPPNLSVDLSFNGSGSLPVNAGQYKVVATINSANYTGVDSATLNVQKASQSITLENIPDKQYGTPPFTITASASSGLPVDLSITTNPAGIATLTGNSILISGLGSVFIKAAQVGNINYNAASEKLDTFIITKASQSIILPGLRDLYFNDTLPIKAASSSGLQVAYTIMAQPVAGIATLKGDTVFSAADTGRITITFSQAGNEFYNAVQVQRTIRVVRFDQTISFNALPQKTFGDAPFAIAATASSGLPVAFRKISGPAEIVKDTITLTGAGTVVIEANQSGNSVYSPAMAVRQSFTVLPDLRAPDLFVQNVSSGQGAVGPNDVITLTWKVANIGTLSSPINWTERFYMQAPNGDNRTLISQSVYSNAASIDTGKNISRSAVITVPAQVNMGDAGVFVVELVPAEIVKEAATTLANNIGIEGTSWAVKKILTVDFSDTSITEGATPGITVTVKRSGLVASPLNLIISLKKPARYNIPSGITIPAGQSGTSFILSVINDQIIQGNILDTLQVSATGFGAVSRNLLVIDDDKPTITITGLAAEVTEGGIVSFQVNTNLLPSAPLQVFLTSGNQARLPLPASVTIPAGKLSASVNLTIAQNSLPEVDAIIPINAGAANHNPAAASILVKDDDLPGITLTLATNTIAENAGYFATQATISRTANSNPIGFRVNLSSSLPGALILPDFITLATNENSKTFTVGVVDNTLVDGDRLVTINASLFVSSCGCTAPPNSAGAVSASLTITDNDGPALTLTASSLTLVEGQTDAGTLRITRNTPTAQPLVVSLTSSDLGEATLPATATIPAGQAFVEVPITTINDGVTDGNKQVYFEGKSAGFSTGSVWVVVTDLNKPDFQITAVSAPASAQQVMTVFNYQVSIKNSGFATAAPGVLVRGYLSLDDVIDAGDSLLTEDITKDAIAQGQSIQVVNAASVPNMPGQYKLIFKVNPLASVTELLLTNNTSQPVPFAINPDYTATAVVANDYYVKSSKIAVTGTAKKSNGSAAANTNVEVYILTNGIRREISALTDGAGNYTTEFAPLTNEVGHYTIGASYPGLKQTAEQDAFDILGVQINNGNIPQFKVILNQTITGSMPVKNLSNTNLTNFSLLKVNLPNATIRFDTLPVLNGNASANIGFTVIGNNLSAGTNFEVATLQAVSKEATIQNIDVFYFCQAPNGLVSASITNINVTTAQGGEKLVQFTLLNRGQGASGKINLSLPQVSWLTSITPIELPSLSTGDSAVVVLKFSGLAEVPFNYAINGNLGVNAQNGNSFIIPYSFQKVSTSLGAVKLTITNQFTYYTDAGPKVKDARVVIKNYYTGQVYADGISDVDGYFEAANIPEGLHRVEVTKDKHLPYSGTIDIAAGQTKETTIFINYQAITFNWSVVPTAVQDQYDITLTTQFETNVPVPVVTIQMPSSMPALSGNEVYAFNATLTNHGLITAKDVAITLPTGDPEYEFVTNYVPSDLLAQQSIQVPIIMRRLNGRPGTGGRPSLGDISQFLGIQAPQQKGTSGGGCTAFTAVVYWYKCNISSGLWQKGGTLFTYSGRTCTNNSGSGSGGGGGIDPAVWGAYSNAFPTCALCPGPGIFAGTSGAPNPYKNEKKSCVQCLSDLAQAIAGCGGINIPPAIACGANTLIAQEGPKSYAQCLLEAALESIASKIPYVSQILCIRSLLNALATCLATAEGRGEGSTRSYRSDGSALGNAFLEIYNNLTVVNHSYDLTVKWNGEYFGALSEKDAWGTLAPMIYPYVHKLDTIPTSSQDSIIIAMKGYDMQAADIKTFFARWNLSIKARALDILSPNAQYPNIINWSNVKLWSDSLITDHNFAINKGFKSINHMNEVERKSMDEVLDNQKNAVCASVTVQLSQQLTMTREAFEGTLEIFNGHPTDKMDSLSVNIQITDQNGVPSNGLFSIQTKSLTNLPDVTGTGVLASQQTGSVKFIFIPEVGAAPQTPKVYNFGGSVRYLDPYAKAIITLPLTNVPLTVNPSPNLYLHYFLQRNILGDDALTTEEIEPSVPAELAVMVENQGYGPAVNMTISSAQPKIIDNEKGLAIEFKLIGSNFQGQPRNLGVTNINFGTIPALQTRIGQWYMTSSLLGKFVSYQASVVHANSFGNPDLSLVKGIKLHELTKSIRLYGANEDGINDFLVNDLFDIHDVPDIIYFSQGNRTSKVYEATSGSFSSTVGAPTFTNVLTVTPSDTGYNYIKLPDPGNRQYEIVSVTRSDGQVIPLDNAWLTFVTLPVSQAPKYENKFHFVDTFPSKTPVTYTVVWKPGNVNPPKIVRITGAPESVSAVPVTLLTVVFDKNIDPTTFTYEDLGLTLQGGPNIMNSSVKVTQADSVTFTVDLSSLTTGNGFYNFTVQAANVKDIFGFNGQTGKNVTWTQFLNVPSVQAFLGLPAGNIATRYDTIDVLFNLPIDTSSISAARFSVYKDSVMVAGSVTIDSVRNDHKLFYLSGLNSLMSQSGVYELRVDLLNIRSETQVYGLQNQSVFVTVDNEGPRLLTMQKSFAGGIDPQHVTFMNMKFNEDVSGFNVSALKLTRNGQLYPLIYTQLSNTDLKTWMAGNFGLITYPDGNYTFTVYNTGLVDALGNPGKDTVSISWTVNHNLVVNITDIGVTPDRGYSATDGVTSGNAFDLSFNLDVDASQVTISQTDLSGEVVLAILTNVTAGNVTLPLVFATGGNTGIKITAVGAAGGVGTGRLNFFVDQRALTGKWMLVNNLQFKTQIDTLPFLFSDKLLKDTSILKTMKLVKNGLDVPTTGIAYQRVNDTLYNFYGIRKTDTLPGNYTMTIGVEKLNKYSSGIGGTAPVSLSWTVLSANRAPLANAGNDTTVTQPGIVRLNGSLSSDPDANPITYRWVAPAGISLSDSTSVMPTFSVTAGMPAGTYKFLLIVSDGTLFNTAVVSVFVNIGNAASITGLASRYCINNSPVTLTGLPAGGTFSGLGISGNQFAPGLAGAGQHSITYNVNGTSAKLNTIVDTIVGAVFVPADTICPGSTAPLLPQQSVNGITGTWSPNAISNSTSGLYRFTPDVGQCAKPALMAVVVLPAIAISTTGLQSAETIYNGGQFTIVHTISGKCSGTSGFVLRDTLPAGFSFISSVPSATLSNNVLSFGATDIGPDETRTFSITLKAPDSKCAIDSVINYNGETRLTGGFVSAGLPGWQKSAARFYSADSAWFVKDTSSSGTADLTAAYTTKPNEYNLSLLSFWHYYNTEKGHDGGVIEYTTNGTEWKDAGEFMIREAYNTFIDTLADKHRMSFSGASNQFVQTVLNVSSLGSIPVAFRYRFVADSTIGGEGWYVDDIVRANGCGGLLKTRLFNSTGEAQDSLVLPIFVLPNPALPLKLVTFTALKSGSQVALDWQTANEINVNSFVVEWSTDGRTWVDIGSVTANNNTNNIYRLMHSQPQNGLNYYRLKMIDNDGRYLNSPVRIVEFKDGNANRLVLLPNPSNTYAVLYLPADIESRFVKMYDAVGSMVRQFKLGAGENQLRISTVNLASGMYTLQAGKYIVRMVVQH